jgi:hypothetical protein
MGYVETTADFDTAIMEAGDRFVAQVQSVLHPQCLAVILLDREGDTGRVAFTWGPPHRFGIPDHASSVHNSGSVSEQSIRINLEGRDGALGAVLLRGDFPHGHNFQQPLPLQAITQELAVALENIQLKERLRRNLANNQALENISSLVAEDLGRSTTYRRFADEVASLIRYDRISIYLAAEKDSALRLASLNGAEACHGEHQSTGILESVDWELIASCGQGLIVQGNGQPVPSARLSLEDYSDLLSTLVVAIRYAGEVVGVVAAASRWTNAYGQADLNLLSKAAAFLGPWIANSRLNDRLKGKVDELAFINKTGLGVGPTNGLEEVFNDLAKALNRLLPFHRGTLTWVDPEGNDISVLH